MESIRFTWQNYFGENLAKEKVVQSQIFFGVFLIRKTISVKCLIKAFYLCFSWRNKRYKNLKTLFIVTGYVFITVAWHSPSKYSTLNTHTCTHTHKTKNFVSLIQNKDIFSIFNSLTYMYEYICYEYVYVYMHTYVLSYAYSHVNFIYFYM